MPAIQPARLKKHVIDLVGKFDQPALFIRELHALLYLYTEHTYRSGQAGEPFMLQSAYNTPAPVMRQVWQELARAAKSDPARVLPLCDALWAEPSYDLQLLAARMLGQMPGVSPEPVFERLQLWIQSGLEKRLLDGVLGYCLEKLHNETPSQLMKMISSWLTASELPIRQAGLRALLSVLNLGGLENLPSILHLLTPYLRLAPSRLRPDIINVLTSLARLSPAETAYALRQNLFTPENPDTAWLIRQVIDEFPEETQKGLRQAMKNTA